jgi:hypothetical protein
MAPLGVCALLTVWIALSAANVRAATFSLLIYGLANLVVYTDAIDFALRLFMRRRHTATAVTTEENRNVSIDLTSALPEELRHRVPMRPYAIIGSVYNLESELEAFTEGPGCARAAGAASTMASTARNPERCADCSSDCHRTSRL